MAKIMIRLIMSDNKEVRNLEELREHFDLEKVVEYYKNGRLLKWLRVRLFDAEADAVEALDENADDFQQELCSIFGVEFNGNSVDVEEITQRQERLAMLREITDEEEYIRHIDQVAFDQEDLGDLLSKGVETVYLCGAHFTVSARRENITYIGINKPTVYIAELEKGNFFSSNIRFEKLKVENFPSTDKIYSSLDMDWQECYILCPGDPLPEGVKETDSVDMWLKRCYKELKLDFIDDELTIVAMPKLDGVALRGEVDAQNHLNRPMLRGDEKKSILVKGLNHIKLTDEDPISDTPFGCQFEVFVTYEDAEEASKYLKLDRPYVSPRHAAAGMLNRLSVNPDENLIPFLSFYPINTEDLGGTYVDRLKQIERFGNVDVVKTRVFTGNIEQLLEKIKRRFQKLRDKRAELPYAIDGMVLSFASDSHQNAIGRKGRTNKWQIAYKFDPASAVGEVKGIELSSGKKGFRTIQVVLKEPVLIDGVKYDHVPALSADIFEKFDLHEGDLIRIHRVGDVIPSISIEERKGGKKIELPKKCPVCGKDMIWEAKKLKCVNGHCNANRAGEILTFCNYAGIDGIGEVEAMKLAEARIDIIMFLDYNFEKCAYNEKTYAICIGGKPKTVESRYEAVGLTKDQMVRYMNQIRSAVKNMWDYEFIGCLGIPGVGKETAKKYFMKYNTDEELREHKLEKDVDTHWYIGIAVDGKVSGMTDLRSNYFKYPTWCPIGLGLCGWDVVDHLNKWCKRSTPEHFANLKSVGHTGGMPSKETQKLIRSLGWELVDGKKFDYLIVPSYKHDSTKTKYAKDKGIELFTEKDFMEEFSEDL